MSPVEAPDDLFGPWFTLLCLAFLAVSVITFAVQGLRKYAGPRRGGAPASQRSAVPASSGAPSSRRGAAPVSSRAPASQRGAPPVSSRAPASQRAEGPLSQRAPVSEASALRVRRRVILLHAVTPGQTPHEYNVGDDAGTRGAALARVA